MPKGVVLGRFLLGVISLQFRSENCTKTGTLFPMLFKWGFFHSSKKCIFSNISVVAGAIDVVEVSFCRARGWAAGGVKEIFTFGPWVPLGPPKGRFFNILFWVQFELCVRGADETVTLT